MEYHMRHEPYESVKIAGFPPESTAPPADKNDGEFNPYPKEADNGYAVRKAG